MAKEESSPNAEAINAVRLFAGSVTLPLLYGQQQPLPFGTASLLEIRGSIFLISAAHNYQDLQLELFAVPERTLAPARGRAIGLSGELIRPVAAQRDLIDVSVLELSSDCASQILSSGWKALQLDNIRPATSQGIFVLCGYPSEKIRHDLDTTVATMITAITERLAQPPTDVNFSADPDPSVDLFFHYDAVAIDTDGIEVATPRLHGASGANVWQYFEPTKNELWTAEKALKAVAIQSSEVKHECFRAKTWAAPLSAIRIARPEFGDVISPTFGNVAFDGSIVVRPE